jgi:hypothetical protein
MSIRHILGDVHTSRKKMMPLSTGLLQKLHAIGDKGLHVKELKATLLTTWIRKEILCIQEPKRVKR